MFKQILIPLDFSAHSTAALRLGTDLARRYQGSVTLLHVHDPLPYALPVEYELLNTEQRRELDRQIDKALAAAKRRAETAGAPNVQVERREGNAASVIAEFAAAGRFDLIVMGTHGRRGIQHAVLGSVAERVVRLAPCPVLTVRAPDEAGGEQIWPTERAK